MRQSFRRFMIGSDGTAGAGLVEFAIIAPVMIVIFTFLGDAGYVVFRKMQVQHAAQAGAQYVVAHPSTWTSTLVSAAVTHATSYNAVTAAPAPSQFCGCPSSTQLQHLNSCAASCGSTIGTYVTVSAQATYSNLFTVGSHTLTASATVRIQ
jgi:Flp pilus assembly protein TadG